MGIVEDFLKKKSEKSEPAAVESSGIVEKYLKSTTDDNSNRTIPNVPMSPDTTITYSTPEEAAAREYKGGPSSREFPNPASIVGNKALEGVKTIGEGVGDIFQNKPATGFGKVGSGILESAFSIPSGAGEFVDKVIGKPEGVASFGDRASLLAGGAAPVKGVVKTINKLPKNEAFRNLVEDIGVENAGYVAKEMRANPKLTPADLSPNVRMGVQKLHANVEGPQVNYIEGVAKQRLEGAAKDLEQHMNANLGTVVNPVEKLKALKDNIREVGKEKINPALANSKPVDTDSVVKFIDGIAKPGINSELNLKTGLTSPEIEKELSHIRKYLTDGKSVRTDPNQLNDIQSMFRVTSEKLLASQDGASKRMGAILAEVRGKLVDAIDNASGGKYKSALKDYRDEFHIQDAFEHGHDTIMKNGKSLSDRPEFFEKWVKDASKHELEAAREGARVAYDTQMYGFKHAARRGTDIGDVEFNRRRMSALFGKEEADKMFKVFEDAKKIAETNNKLAQGSQSRIQKVQDTRFEPHSSKTKNENGAVSAAIYGGLPIAGEVASQFLAGSTGGGLATLLALGAAKSIGAGASAAKNAVIKKIENERNMSYSKLALPVEPIARERLIQQLEAVANAPVKPSFMNRTASKITRTVPP